MTSNWIQRMIGWAWFTSPHRRLLVIAALAGLLVAAVFLARPATNAFRGWRAERLVAEARSHADGGNWREAYRTAKSAWQIRDSVEALRIYVRAARKIGDPHRLYLATALFVHPQASNEDRCASLETFIDANDLIAAAEMIRSLEQDDYSPAMWLQVTRFLVNSGQFQEALNAAEVEASQRRGACDLVVVQALVKTGAPGVRNEVARRLRRLLAGTNADESLRAMRLLASLPADWIAPDLARLAVEKFGPRTDLASSDRLRIALFRIALDPDSRGELIEAGITANRDQNLEGLVGWLMRLGEAERVLDLTRSQAGLSPALYEHRTNALAGLERYDELAAELETPPPSLRKVTVAAVRATVAEKRGEHAEAVTWWRKSFELARLNRERNDYYTIAEVARRAGDHERHMEALSFALEHSLGVPPTMHEVRNVLQWMYEQGEPVRLASISYRLLEREPGNPLLININHYVRLLTDQPGANMRRELQALVDSFPAELAFRSTFALGLLKTGDPSAALAQFENLDIPPAEFPPADRGIYAAALVANGRAEEAQDLSDAIAWEELPAFESKALRELLNRADEGDFRPADVDGNQTPQRGEPAREPGTSPAPE